MEHFWGKMHGTFLGKIAWNVFGEKMYETNLGKNL